MERENLVACFENTLKIAEGKDLQDNTARAKMFSKVYPEGFTASRKEKSAEAKVDVINGTSFATAKEYADKGRIAVLSFANPEAPGGGVSNGAMAQEECLCRCSNLYPCLNQPSVFDAYYGYHRSLKNPFYTDRLIYSAGITVFKYESLSLMEKSDWFQVDIISCAAPYLAKRKYTNKKALLELFKSRIKNIFEAAIDNQVDVLILGAFGCGAFKNPPEIVARAFHEVIWENGYVSQFDKIIFAIKSTVNNDPFQPCPNIMAFEREFTGISAEANKRRFFDPSFSDQAIGQIVMPSGKILKSGEQIISYNKWKKENKYFGKQFSVLGDSISTLAGYNPKDYRLFYTEQNAESTGVKDMKDTWWGKVINFFGGELLVNNSWSGSRVTKLPNQEGLFPSACSDERASALHIGHVMPDVILVYLGTNDWATGINVNIMPECNANRDECFDYAYATMLSKLRSNYPNAEIWCCTLCSTFMSQNAGFKFPKAYAGTHIEKYNTVIRSVSRSANCKIVDLYQYAIPYDSVDGTHPTVTGMSTLATMAIRSMADDSATEFYQCNDNEHDFITAEMYTGGTKYACKKCALIGHSSTLIPGKFERNYVGSRMDGVVIPPINTRRNSSGDGQTIGLYNKKNNSSGDGHTVLLYPNYLLLDRQGKTIRVDKEVITVGREKHCDIVLEESAASRNHAMFIFHYGAWYLVDLQSKNGVKLNGARITPNTEYLLSHDDGIVFAASEKYIFFRNYGCPNDNDSVDLSDQSNDNAETKRPPKKGLFERLFGK